MTVFGHPVLFDCLKNMEDTASEKTPMQWHTTRTLSLDNALVHPRNRLIGLLRHRISKQLSDRRTLLGLGIQHFRHSAGFDC